MANALKAYLMAEAQGRGPLGSGIRRGFELGAMEREAKRREQRQSEEFDRRFTKQTEADTQRVGLSSARSLISKLSDKLRGFDDETNNILSTMKNARLRASGGLGEMDPVEINDFLAGRAQQKARLHELVMETSKEAERRFPGQWFGRLPFGTLSGEELVGTKTVTGGGQQIGGGFRFTPGTMSVEQPPLPSQGDFNQMFESMQGSPSGSVDFENRETDRLGTKAPLISNTSMEIESSFDPGIATRPGSQPAQVGGISSVRGGALAQPQAAPLTQTSTTYDPSNVFDIARGEQKVPDALLRAQRAAERAFAEEDDFGGGGVGGARPGALTSQQIQSILPQTVTGTGATMMITPEQLQRLNQALQPPQDARFLGRHSRGQEDPTQEQLRLMEAFGGNVGTSTALRNMLLTDPVLGRKK